MKNNQRMRPQMDEYIQETKQSTSHYDQNKTPKQPQVAHSTVREPEKNSYEEEKPSHRTSQSHKKNEKDYKINPKVIPRPNHYDEVYKTIEKQSPIYDTNEDVYPPHSSVHYIVNETQNSSCRLIRSTLTKLPTDQATLNGSSLLFGLYMQPFAEFNEEEKEIPKVEINEQIFRCKRCNSYINSKYEITYSKSNKQVAKCNICSCENELDSSKPSVKSEYFNSVVNEVAELKYPTIDFNTPQNMKHQIPFAPHYILMIDITQISCDLGLPSYILNSISSNLEFIHAASNSFLSIATYDSRSIHFFSLDKNKEVRASIVSDINEPFCPIPREKLFLHVNDQQSEINLMIEKINYFINERQHKYGNRKAIPGAITGAAMVAAASALEDNGGRVMIFTCNSTGAGFAACKPRTEIPNTQTPTVKPYCIPQHDKLKILAEQCVQKRIAVDQFVIANQQYDLATYSVISNITGGQVLYYPMNPKDMSDLKFKFEKLHYDLSRILTRPNYYDVRFMLRYSIGFECVEILGPFGTRLGEGFQLASCDPDYSFYYNLRLSESLKPDQRYHFQFVVLYVDNFNERYLRTINYTILTTSEVSKIYASSDVDALAKLTLLKEISIFLRSDTNSARANIVNRIVNSFYFYRNNCSKTTQSSQLILPASVKYYPLYLNSFIKKFICNLSKSAMPINSLIDMMNKITREPLYHTIKFLYPKFYRIDDIQNDQSYRFAGVDKDYIIKEVGLTNETLGTITKPFLIPNSLDNIDFDCAYLSDDGDYITLYVFNSIEEPFYQELFNIESWEEGVTQGINAIDETTSSTMSERVLNIVNQLRKDNKGKTQPVRVFFLDERQYNNAELANILVEDHTKTEPNYVEFLCGLHEEIQKKIN